jgi:hypothetical protein
MTAANATGAVSIVRYLPRRLLRERGSQPAGVQLVLAGGEAADLR